MAQGIYWRSLLLQQRNHLLLTKEPILDMILQQTNLELLISMAAYQPTSSQLKGLIIGLNK